MLREGFAMKDDALNMCMLFDFYGAILTERQQEVFDLYYNEDLSLAEISENSGITRQGVRDAIARSRNILLEMEDKLGLAARFKATSGAFTEICGLSQEIADYNATRFRSNEIEKRLVKIVDIAEQFI